MPVVPVHDLAVKDNDLVVATHGRSLWILDDISPLRQINSEVASSASYLFQPATAVRIRASTNHDTPFTPEVPAGENPPPGAVIYYYLKSPAKGEVKIEILDGHGQPVRAFSSNDRATAPAAPPPFPVYWFRPPEQLSTAAGMHRRVWDLRYSTPPTQFPGYSMSTVFGRDVPREPVGPQALPGIYQVKLTVDGKSYVRQFNVVMDPRVKATPHDLAIQLALATKLSQALEKANQTMREIHEARATDHVSAETEKKLIGVRRGGGEEDDSASQLTLNRVAGNLSQLLSVVDSADAAPTTQAAKAAEQTISQLEALLQQWAETKK
jgi:hypothetical protein